MNPAMRPQLLSPSESPGEFSHSAPNLYPLALDILREAITRLPACRTPAELCDVLDQSARFLLPSASMGILLRQPDACFELIHCSPMTAWESMHTLTEHLIDSGCFARALQQRHGYATDVPDQTSLLQRLATPRRIDGMVVWVERRIPALLHQPLGALADLAALSLSRLHSDTEDGQPPAYQDLAQFNTPLLSHEVIIPTDHLTGLAHRTRFIRFLQRAMAEDVSPSGVGVILLDIDGFHRVNREFGCETGDQVLRDVAQRLDGALRSRFIQDELGIADCDLCFARTGADEFGLALSHMRYPQFLPDIAAHLHSHLADGFRQNDSRLHLSVSIGVASLDNEAGTPSAQALLRSADTALKRAKLAGRNQYAVYESAWNETGSVHLRTESLLQEALRKDQFVLHFQPLFRLDDQTLIGAEVLLRLWIGDDAPLPPATFIPIAESSGQIVEIGEWVLRRVCRQIHAWDAQGFPPIPLSINVSAIELSRADLTPRLSHILDQSHIPVARIHIEITETAIAHNEDQALANINALRAAGFEVWIDDFGTGYSSLKSIKNFPISGLKLDREFVKDLAHSPAAEAITGSILSMARQLGYPVVGEGIEEAAQLQFLQQHGCHAGQGFHLGRPVSPETFQDCYFR